jgi:hypothetical protein
MVWISEKNLIHHYHYYNFWLLKILMSLPSTRLFGRMPLKEFIFRESVVVIW